MAETSELQTFTCSFFKRFAIQMPGTMVLGTWIAYRNSNGDLKSEPFNNQSNFLDLKL